MTLPISITVERRSVTPSRPVYWVPHDRARYDYDSPTTGGWRFNPQIDGKARAAAREHNQSLPEVYRQLPQHATRLLTAHYELVVGINPDLEPDKALTLLGEGLGWCNTQWGVFDQARLCGGALITGTPGYSLARALGDAVRLAVGIVSQRARTFMAIRRPFRALLTENNVLIVQNHLLTDPVPSAEEALRDPVGHCVYYGTGVQPDGDVNLMLRRGRDGGMYPARMVLITRYPIRIPFDEIVRLPEGFLPGPQWMPAKG